MPDTWRALRPWLHFAGAVLVVAVLYLAQAVIVPIALALLLTFLLSPPAAALQRRVGRVASVVIVVTLAFSVIGAVGWVVAIQVRSLADDLPRYRHNIREKVQDIRSAGRGSLDGVRETVQEITEGMGGAPAATPRENTSGTVRDFPATLGPVLEGVATAGLVVVLVVFMLLQRQQLRDRVIRVLGHRRLAATTRAIDEAGARISRYLLMQGITNGTFGLGIGVGLFLLGLPYALLWGLLAATLRFIPYVGPWVAAIAPILLGLAAFEGWLRPLLVVALFIVLELFSNLVMETLLYAGAAGVSEVALLVAVAFWTWLWGAPGLLMATPLTVCLVVLAKHVSALEWLVTIMGDEPGLSADVSYYQRLLAGDADEAAQIVDAHLRDHERETVHDAVLLPALAYARRDRLAGRISEEEEARLVRATRDVLDDIAEPVGPGAAPGALPTATIVVLGCPVGGEAEEVALRMLARVLEGTAVALEAASARVLSAEIVARVVGGGHAAVCLASIPPAAVAPARYLCKKLRREAPDAAILVGRWGPPGLAEESSDAWTAAGATHVAHTLLDTRTQLLTLLPQVRAGVVPSAA